MEESVPFLCFLMQKQVEVFPLWPSSFLPLHSPTKWPLVPSEVPICYGYGPGQGSSYSETLPS